MPGPGGGPGGRISRGLEKLPRIRAAYNAYQDLLRRMESGWKIPLLQEWLESLPDYIEDEIQEGQKIQPLTEFSLLKDVLNLYEDQVQHYLDNEKKPPSAVESAVTGLLDALDYMPYCIYDVLHARMLTNVEQELIEIDDKKYRMGVRVDKLTEAMNDIAQKIRDKKEREEYGYDTED